MIATAPTASILDDVKHARLIKDIDHIAETANIPAHVIHRSAVGFINSVETDWLRHFNAYRQQGRAGLVIAGEIDSPELKMMAITGALVRNFIDARFVTLNSLLTLAEDGDTPEPTVLVISNLYTTTTKARTALQAFKIQSIYDILLRRMALNKPTVMYIENLEMCESAYGQLFTRHLKNHYKFS